MSVPKNLNHPVAIALRRPEDPASNAKRFDYSIQHEMEVCGNSGKCNWKGIGITALITVIICSLISVAIFLLPPRQTETKIKKDKIFLEEIIHGAFSPRGFNGTWISDHELIYRDQYGNLVMLDMDKIRPAGDQKSSSSSSAASPLVQDQPISLNGNLNEKAVLLVSNTTFANYFVQKYSLSPDRQYVLMVFEVKKIFRHTYLAQHRLLRISDGQMLSITEEPADRASDLQCAEFGPNGSLVYVHNDDVFYKSSAEAKAITVATSPQQSVVLNGIPDWLYEEEILGTSNAIWFSPNGTRLAYASFNDTLVDEMQLPYYGDYNDPENVYTGTYRFRYPKPGRINPTVTLWVVDLATTRIATHTVIPPQKIAETEHYFTRVAWVDEDSLMVIWLTRQQNFSVITLCTARNEWQCETNLEVSEKSGWVDLYEEPVFSDDRRYYFLRLPKKQNDRDGYFRHIAKIPVENGRKLQFITSGSHDITDILSFDGKRNKLFYLSTLRQKAGERHLFELDINSFEDRCLTCGWDPTNCLYNQAKFSERSSYFALECLGPGIPRVELRRSRDNQLYGITQSNQQISEKLEKKSLPVIRHLSVPCDDGSYTITKYPLLIQVYGGPGSQSVSEKFGISYAYFLSTQKKYIYGIIDGRGSGFKGDKFLQEIYGRLGSVEIDDQIAVTKHLRDTLPYIDPDKIGIWGWSYGGYVSAMALVSEKNSPSPIFSCAMSVAPVTNWLLYDSAYTERYMGLPGDHGNYDKANLLHKVGNMKGKKFLLVHGSLDDNVHFQHSAMLLKALQNHGILFHFGMYPDQSHSLIGATLHLYRTLGAFLDECFVDSGQTDDVGLRTRAGAKNNEA